MLPRKKKTTYYFTLEHVKFAPQAIFFKIIVIAMKMTLNKGLINNSFM